MQEKESKSKYSVDEIVDDLIARIQKQEYRPGDKLREADICLLYNVSRTPVREAFRRLQAVGFLNYVPQHGVQIANFDMDMLHHTQNVRGVLEVLASKTAAERIGEGEIARLKEINHRFGEIIDIATCHEMDDAFHTVIARCTGNDVLVEYLANLNLRAQALRYMIPFRRERIPLSVQEHENIIRAFELRDPFLAEKYTQIHFHMSLASLEHKLSEYIDEKCCLPSGRQH